ncbi:DUF3857 domain-containing transglutaminase family protein [Flaviaesturariibacter amylovorans]|uniref:Transglutaminase-like domain-containing protein n=1 Tax=Flaviaesturariibacter amylovorans TaxID=1084520 RepID=A0ABP8G7K5_9BACT
MRAFCLCVLLLCVYGAVAQPVRTGPAPGWITTRPLNLSDRTLDDDAEDGYVDLCFERQVHLGEGSTFIRTARRVLTDAGVQNAAEVSVDYDPLYEQLRFHSVRILRGSTVLDRLDARRFRIIQQEKERSMHLYNGELTALLALDDVRQGDVIEYSYTLTGRNPVFGGRYAGNFDTRFTVPVYALCYKLVVPAGRSITVRNWKTDLQPLVRDAGGARTYEWRQERVPLLEVPAQLPTWYDPYPMIMVSEWRSWKEVNDWALGLFPQQGPLPASLAALAGGWRRKYPTTEAQVAAALRFVQDEVRYLGIEMGVNSHKPNDPERILRQRFGDCKDKSYLFCTLMRALGVPASPVLLHTDYKKGVRNWLPTPTGFDHCTVQVRLNGRSYYFDPTSTYQRGSLDDISFPDYQCGLVVAPGNGELTDIPLQDKARIDVHERFVFPDMSGTGRLEVTTTYRGSAADALRADFGNTRRADKQKQYQEYYAAYFDKVRSDSIKYTDHESGNRFVVQEYYTLRGAWTGKEGRKKLELSAFVIGGMFKKPADDDRSAPLSLVFPAHYREEIELELPEDWGDYHADDDFSGPGYRYTFKARGKGQHVVLTYDFRSERDHVLSGELDAFRTAYAAMSERAGYSLTYGYGGDAAERSADAARKVYRPITRQELLNSAYVLLGVAVLITYLVRRNRRRR